MTGMHENEMAEAGNEPGKSGDDLRQELTREIQRLNRFSTRGVQALALFIIISIIAWWDFPLLPKPETVTALLGTPPTARMISIALLLYTFSAIILSLARMTTGIEHRSSFCHAGYLAAFYLFYYFGRSLEDNYWAVFGAGITILGVESYRIWTFCAEAVAKIKAELDFVIRTGRPPPRE